MTRSSVIKEALEGLPLIISLHDIENTIIWANKAYREATGRTLEEIVDRKCHSAWGLNQSCRNCPVFRTLATGEPAEAKLTPRNQAHWPESQGSWLIKSSPLRNDDGTLVGALEMAFDITEAERSEENYATLFREMLNGFALHEIICDAAGCPADYRFLSVNPSFERMTGLKADAVIGKTVREVLPDIEPEWIARYGKVALTGEPTFFESTSKALGKWFEVAAFRPSPNRFACIFADVTERKQAEKEHEKLRAQLAQAQKMESVGRLAGGVAHDFNNLLSVILGYTELALEQVNASVPLHADLKEVYNAARRSAEITRKLLAFARKQPISPRVLDLNETVESMMKMLRRLIGEDIDLVWRPGATTGLVRVDPSQVDQILANLCLNARDAIAGVGKITIETAPATLDAAFCAAHAGSIRGDYALLAVSDTGCGMDADALSHVFEPFYTTKDMGHGTGLGLATVYGIVKQNNGFIDVTSQPKTGTAFCIYLPSYVGTASLSEKCSEADLPMGNGETVLIVEDDAPILSLAKIMLDRLGYTVLTAATPDRAMELAQANRGRIDLLLTDVVMPMMNGRDLANRLQSAYPDLKVLFMSGYTADVIAHRGALEAGVSFLQKPFGNRELANKVRATLRPN